MWKQKCFNKIKYFCFTFEKAFTAWVCQVRSRLSRFRLRSPTRWRGDGPTAARHFVTTQKYRTEGSYLYQPVCIAERAATRPAVSAACMVNALRSAQKRIGPLERGRSYSLFLPLEFNTLSGR